MPEPQPLMTAAQYRALGVLKNAARDAFRLCADSAERMAVDVESGKLPIDAPIALRLLAQMFLSSAERD